LKSVLKKCMIGLIIGLNASPFSTLSGVGYLKQVIVTLFLNREEENLVNEINFLMDLRKLP